MVTLQKFSPLAKNFMVPEVTVRPLGGRWTSRSVDIHMPIIYIYIYIYLYISIYMYMYIHNYNCRLPPLYLLKVCPGQNDQNRLRPESELATSKSCVLALYNRGGDSLEKQGVFFLGGQLHSS
jgi:hypothetical protein